MRHHIPICHTQIREFVFVSARHLRNHRSFLMNNLVMGKYENKFLAVCIYHTERQIVVMIFAVQRIKLHIVQEIIHPSHIPLVIKSKSASLNRMRHHRPCR